MISIKNIYFLLLYAWEQFDANHMEAVDAEPETELVSLLATVLTRGTDHVLRRGLDRGYLHATEILPGIRGRVAMSATLKANVLIRGKVVCEFDDLSHDVLHNRILKATLRRLLKADTLDSKLREPIRTACSRLSGVRDIHLMRRSFRGLQLHGNISCYRFLMDVCRLLFDHLIPDEASGNYRFKDFSKDEKVMRRIFERFLYNFFKHEQSVFEVARRRFHWAVEFQQKCELLPTMHTDVTLTHSRQVVVIEAKYTPRVFQQHLYGSDTLRSAHLYQLYAYLQNFPLMGATSVDGLLLYPLAKDPVDATVSLAGHNLRIYTVNLNQHWRLIRRDLIALVIDHKSPQPHVAGWLERDCVQ